MSFVRNDSQQMSFEDSFYGLTTRERKRLDKSWAKYFSDNIFPMIDEDRFEELYSDKDSRPNTPVNVILGGLMLKELFGMTDEEFMDTLMFDARFQYALHTTSCEEQPISDRTFGRFRQRCNAYCTETGIDLIQEAVEELSKQMAAMMKIDGRLKRMDSMMVASNIKKLSRLELMYTCVANMVNELKRNGVSIPAELVHYTEKDDLNRVIYHAKSEQADSRLAVVLKEAKTVVELCGSSYDGSNNYQLLMRALHDQTIRDENGNYTAKESGDSGMNSHILQNPSDPDATYRKKAGKENRGYVANIVEDVSEDGNSIVTMYQYEQNTYSDTQFTEDTLNKIGKREEPITMTADGAYDSEENQKLAEENNIKLITTDLLGKKPKEIYADFVLNKEGTEVLSCPAGHEPKSCSYNEKTGQITLSFTRECCENCPYRNQCTPKEYKKTFKLRISSKSHRRAKQIRARGSEEFKKYANIRNGAETVPSYLRRKYNVDRIPVRGLIRSRLFFGFKICASNIKKFCRYMQDQASVPVVPEMA